MANPNPMPPFHPPMEEDELVSVLPIRLSNTLSPNVHLHQFPLLTRPLQVPPSAAASGKRIRARLKPRAARLEIHVPVDGRPEVWNVERSKELGAARVQDDHEHAQDSRKVNAKEGDDPRLTEVRLRSERLPEQGVYMLGVIREGQLHLHPISQFHQLRPSMTYLDLMSRKSKRPRGGGIAGASDSDSDSGPPPDPDEQPTSSTPKKQRGQKPIDATEVQVAVRSSDEKQILQGAISGVRREMLHALRVEEEESWDDLEYFDGETPEASDAFDNIFSKSDAQLRCTTTLGDVLHSISGLSLS